METHESGDGRKDGIVVTLLTLQETTQDLWVDLCDPRQTDFVRFRSIRCRGVCRFAGEVYFKLFGEY